MIQSKSICGMDHMWYTGPRKASIDYTYDQWDNCWWINLHILHFIFLTMNQLVELVLKLLWFWSLYFCSITNMINIGRNTLSTQWWWWWYRFLKDYVNYDAVNLQNTMKEIILFNLPLFLYWNPLFIDQLEPKEHSISLQYLNLNIHLPSVQITTFLQDESLGLSSTLPQSSRSDWSSSVSLTME